MAAASAQARLTLQDAFERFASTVTPDDQRLFQNTEIKDVRDEAMRIERHLRARRMQKNMARLEPFLKGLQHYSKVVEVLCNGTPYLPWIWAPVKLMLMITVDSISAFEKLIEAYGKIADMLPRLDRLGNALVNDYNFQNVLALVYSDIIEFHRRAYKFVRRKSWAIFFGSMWAGFESRFSGILKTLAYHSELLDKEAAAVEISDAIRRNKANEEDWEKQQREWNATKIQRVLTWLGMTDILPADVLERHMRHYLPGSCDWFVQHKATRLWLGDSAKNALMWLSGKPGAGKSTICSAIVQHAEANDVHIFYYFCSFLGSQSDGPNRLLRSFISQVIQKHQDLAIYVHDVYFDSHPVPTKRALLNLLPELLRGLGSVRLVVDGIDEWSAADQREILKDISQLTSIDQSSHICKVLIASRETIDTLRSLRKKDRSALSISLGDSDEALAVTRSIAGFVDSQLSDLPAHIEELDPDASIMIHVKDTLLKKSHGMFLWVRLVLKSLDAVYTPEQLRAVVDELPSDLETLYEQILVRLCDVPGAQSYGGVSRIMSWVCLAQRPLHKSELLQALSILPDDTGPTMRSIPIAAILEHCKPLIEELSDSTIVPVHFSVKEYILKSHIPQIVPAIDAALDMLSACAIVIARGFELLRLENSSIDHLGRVASGNYRLLPYAIEFWIDHCMRYASVGGNLGPDRPFQYHVTRMCETHKECMHALGHVIQVDTKDEPKVTLVDEQLGLFLNTPIHCLMSDVLRFRRVASQLNDDNRSDIETYIINNDRTLFSKLAQMYESAVVHLLARQEVEGISPTILRAFQESYASTAFRCRFPYCDRLSLGFANAELRLEHEAVHVQRLYCQTSSCPYTRIGFATKSALNSHTRKHHGQSYISLIPAKVRRATDAQAESDPTMLSNNTQQQQPVPQQLADKSMPSIDLRPIDFNDDEDLMNFYFDRLHNQPDGPQNAGLEDFRLFGDAEEVQEQPAQPPSSDPHTDDNIHGEDLPFDPSFVPDKEEFDFDVYLINVEEVIHLRQKLQAQGLGVDASDDQLRHHILKQQRANQNRQQEQQRMQAQPLHQQQQFQEEQQSQVPSPQPLGMLQFLRNQPLTEDDRKSVIPQDLDPQVQAQLLKVPEQQFHAILQHFERNKLQQSQQGPFATNQPILQRPPQQTNQQRLAFKQQRLAVAQKMLRQSPGMIQATDSRVYPPNLFNLELRAIIPQGVKTWGQVKLWTSQNSSLLPAGFDVEKLILLQALHFQELVRQQRSASR